MVVKSKVLPENMGYCSVCARAFPLLNRPGRYIPRHTYQRVRTCAGSMKKAA